MCDILKKAPLEAPFLISHRGNYTKKFGNQLGSCQRTGTISLNIPSKKAMVPIK